MVMPKKTRSISVIGLVNKPGIYELPEDGSKLRILDALALAGDRRLSVADRVRVIRQRDEGSAATIQVSVKKAGKNQDENILIAAGDTVIVDETPLTVTVSTIRGFLRFGFSSALPGF